LTIPLGPFGSIFNWGADPNSRAAITMQENLYIVQYYFTEVPSAIVNQNQFSERLSIDRGLARRYSGGLARRLSCPPSLWRSGGLAC